MLDRELWYEKVKSRWQELGLKGNAPDIELFDE
jgi:hypothetical protein